MLFFNTCCFSRKTETVQEHEAVGASFAPPSGTEETPVRRARPTGRVQRRDGPTTPDVVDFSQRIAPQQLGLAPTVCTEAAAAEQKQPEELPAVAAEVRKSPAVVGRPQGRADSADSAASGGSLSSAPTDARGNAEALLESDAQSAAVAQCEVSPRSRAAQCILPLDAERVSVGGRIFTLSRELGRGGFGVVYEGHATGPRGDKLLLALKLTAVEKPRFDSDLQRAQRTTGRQYKYLHLVNTFVVEELKHVEHGIAARAFHGKIADLATCRFFWTAMSLGSTDLRSALSSLKSAGRRLPAQHAVTWAQQAAKAVAWLASKGIVHCDVKVENYVLAADPGQERLLLADLEGSVPAGSREATVRGTFPYLDPNVFRHLVEPGHLSRDVYALGVVIHCILTGGQLPTGVKQVYVDNAATLRPVQGAPAVLTPLLQPAWARDIAQRPTAVQLLQGLNQELVSALMGPEAESYASVVDAPLADDDNVFYQQLLRVGLAAQPA